MKTIITLKTENTTANSLNRELTERHANLKIAHEAIKEQLSNVTGAVSASKAAAEAAIAAEKAMKEKVQQTQLENRSLAERNANFEVNLSN